MTTKHVISVSGGKDSTATLLIALENCPPGSVVPIFCDTGNEHEAVHEYLSYLEQALDLTIYRLKADFSEQIVSKRMFIARDQRHGRKYDTAPVFDADGNPVPKRDKRGNIITTTVRRNGEQITEPVQKTRKFGGGRRIRWTNKAKRRALAALYSTGNPFIDLCMWKGRFPSRKAQFCTEELKRNIAVAFQIDLVDAGFNVLSWQGVRRNESQNRRNAKKIERLAPKLWVFRPIVEWSAQQVFDFCAKRNVQPNPLYKQGMGRVGCMPCINAGKEEITQIAARFPAYLEEKASWETAVSLASKRGYSTFFNKELHNGNKADRRIYEANRIEEVIRWARTSRGGKQFDLLAQADVIDVDSCASAYGLCERWEKAP